MGADIHIYAEVKLKNGQWAMTHAFEPQPRRVFGWPENPGEHGLLFYTVGSRNYSFFAALAGVRGDGPEPRGLPNDVSPLVQQEADSWGSDGHSHSWMYPEEFAKVFMEHHMSNAEVATLVERRMNARWSRDLTLTILQDYIGVTLPEDDEGNPDAYGLRFVFWFDN